MVNIQSIPERLRLLPDGEQLNVLFNNGGNNEDLPNEFFRIFLDPTLTFSGAWFSHDGMTLEQAQIAKYERLSAQLHLRPHDQILEIGTGWGSNAIHMARRYGCRVTTLT